MSSFVKVITKVLDNLIQLNGNNITIIKDNNNKIWFSINEIFRALGYKNITAEVQRVNIPNSNIKTYREIYNELPKNIQESITHIKNFQFLIKMTDESGIYMILNKSRKNLAQQYKDELFTNILPILRENGEFKFNQKDRKKLDNIKTKLNKTTHKLHLIKKEQQIHSKTKKQYNNLSGKGFIYILKVKTIQDGKEKQCHKIGYASNLNKRLATYKTGNPDVELVHQENVNCNKKQLEKCVLNLNILKRLSSKNEVICDSPLEEIKKEIEDCKKLITRYSSTKAKSS